MAAAPGFQKHPDYEIVTENPSQRYQVRFNGVVIADSKRPMLLRESRHHPVYYIPKADVAMQHLKPTAQESYCPFKGTARYWSIEVGERCAENAVWAYDEPYDELAKIGDYVAFYPDRVDEVLVDGEAQPATGPGWTR